MKKRLNRKINSNSAFTLAELLIVVAIIAVLVAIAIPIFTKQLEKAREATDLANIRSAYAEVMVEVITDENTGFKSNVNLKQKQQGWQTTGAKATLQSLGTVEGDPNNGGKCEVSWNGTAILFKFDGESQQESEPESESESSSSAESDRKLLMKAAANGLKKGFAEIIPSEKIEQARSCLHTDSYTANNGDPVNVIELNISENNLQRGAYWNPSPVTWKQVLEDAGVNLSKIGDLNGYIYMDNDLNMISVSYFNEEGKYCYTFLDDDKTIEMSRMPGERQHAGYYKDYAESMGTVVTG